MLKQVATKQFRKDIKLLKKRGKDIEKLITIIGLLLADNALPAHYADHLLKGSYHGRRECHLESNWLLIYKTQGEYLILERCGTHADLFE